MDKFNLGSRLKSAKDFDLFSPTVKTTESLSEIDVNILKPYPNHPFKPYTEERLAELAQSISENGLLHPVIILEKDSDFFILSGHNRVNAHKLLGLAKVQAIVKRDIDDETADLIVVESNLKQREKLLPSEKAKAYKMQLDAIKKRAGRPAQSNYSPMGNNLQTTSSAELANEIGESKNQIYRYISLNNLFASLLDLVDNDELPFRVGVELSYLKENEQTAVYDYFIIEEKAKLDLKTATAIKDLAKNKDITYETLDKLMNGKAKNQKKIADIKIPVKKLGGMLDDVAEDSRMEYIIKAIEFYKNNSKDNTDI